MATTTNKRAERVWARLIQSYGTRIAEMYGANMPQPWIDAVADFSDEQLKFGLRAVLVTSPIHPPALGQFMQACSNMPVQQEQRGPTVQEQLCSWVALLMHATLSPREFCAPWTYIYRESWDNTRPKGFERCAECIGVIIDKDDGTRLGLQYEHLLADTEMHRKVMAYFRPGPKPSPKQSDALRAIRQP